MGMRIFAGSKKAAEQLPPPFEKNARGKWQEIRTSVPHAVSAAM
jgi:hypothetical protein